MLRLSGSSQNPDSSILHKLQLSMVFSGRPVRRPFTVKKNKVDLTLKIMQPITINFLS